MDPKPQRDLIMQIQMGLKMYQAPELRMELQCKTCGCDVTKTDVGTADEAITQDRCGNLGDPPMTKWVKCPTCRRTRLMEVAPTPLPAPTELARRAALREAIVTCLATAISLKAHRLRAEVSELMGDDFRKQRRAEVTTLLKRMVDCKAVRETKIGGLADYSLIKESDALTIDITTL